MMIVSDANAYEAAGQGYASAGTYGWGGGFRRVVQNDPVEDMALIWLQEVLPPPRAQMARCAAFQASPQRSRSKGGLHRRGLSPRLRLAPRLWCGTANRCHVLCAFNHLKP